MIKASEALLRDLARAAEAGLRLRLIWRLSAGERSAGHRMACASSSRCLDLGSGTYLLLFPDKGEKLFHRVAEAYLAGTSTDPLVS